MVVWCKPILVLNFCPLVKLNNNSRLFVSRNQVEEKCSLVDSARHSCQTPPGTGNEVKFISSNKPHSQLPDKENGVVFSSPFCSVTTASPSSPALPSNQFQCFKLRDGSFITRAPTLTSSEGPKHPSHNLGDTGDHIIYVDGEGASRRVELVSKLLNSGQYYYNFDTV